LLKEVAKKHGIDLGLFVRDDEAWDITRSDQETLIDAISAEFSATGLQSDSEPNSRGLQLEELLDKINQLD
jgi:hypothetical protein